ncbi:hypothetical protein CGMCC3_g3111 [Colletotrichum fructicola]|nr:uncharacterized protein CGMCC3_g3111 [Colletotrichum fructicola]KAE9580928.1 hypothetical protein CGMCC3_g3111 [Colletotrichum fructicola]
MGVLSTDSFLSWPWAGFGTVVGEKISVYRASKYGYPKLRFPLLWRISSFGPAVGCGARRLSNATLFDLGSLDEKP